MRTNNEIIEQINQTEEFINKKHKFSNDLDIFGKSALFQWINLILHLFFSFTFRLYFIIIFYVHFGM